jgi:hypothetical protein
LLSAKCCVRTLPEEDRTIGFFIACFVRNSASLESMSSPSLMQEIQSVRLSSEHISNQNTNHHFIPSQIPLILPKKRKFADFAINKKFFNAKRRKYHRNNRRLKNTNQTVL